MSMLSAWWRRNGVKEIKTQMETIKITEKDISKVLEWGAAAVVEHDKDKNGKLSGQEKKKIAVTLVENVIKYARRKWQPKIIRWFNKKTVELLTKIGILKPHKEN